MPRVSAFAGLDAIPNTILTQPRCRVRLLPRCCGTYALYDRGGDLLYIGKAANLRSRVLSHLREPPSRLLVRHWTHLIGEVEVRPAGGELEALLVEAFLIGRLRPPFNRRMRSWPHYCYLIRSDDPAEPLKLSTQAVSWLTCFGPYRTRRQAMRILEAAFRLVAPPRGDPDLLPALYRLLAGEDDSVLRNLEAAIPVAAEQAPSYSAIADAMSVLHQAFERGRLLHEAQRISGRVLVLASSSELVDAAVITAAGMRIRRLEAEAEPAAIFASCRQAGIESGGASPIGATSKQSSDCLCLAAAHLLKHPGRYRLVDGPSPSSPELV